MHINRYTILIALIPFLVDSHLVPSWASYLVVIALALMTIRNYEPFQHNGLVCGYILVIVTSVFRLQQYSFDMVKDVGLMAIGILPFLAKNNLRVEARGLNLLFMAGFMFLVGTRFLSFNLSIRTFIVSHFGIEMGAYTYTLGLFAVYWMVRDYKRWALLNLVLMFLGGKRIAMAAGIICMLIAFYYRYKEGEVRKLWKLLIAAGCVLYLYISWRFARGAYNDIILEYTEKSADAFALGRQQLFRAVYNIMPDPNLWGVGPGNTCDYLQNTVGLKRMHNDILKVYSENGIFISIGFLLFLLRKLNYKKLPLLIFIMFVYCTTNTFIYVYMIFMYVLFLEADQYIYIGEMSGETNMYIRMMQDKEKIRLRKHANVDSK